MTGCPSIAFAWASLDSSLGEDTLDVDADRISTGSPQPIECLWFKPQVDIRPLRKKS